MDAKGGGDMAENGARSQRVDALRGAAILFVTLGHAVIFYPVNLHEDPGCLLLFNFVSSLHMELLFLLSGWCFHFRGGYGTFIKKKILRLAVPYTVFGLLDMIPRQYLAAMVNRPRSMGESLRQMVLFGGELWFLYALFVIFLLFPVLHLLCEKRPRADLLLLAACLPLARFWAFLPEAFALDRVGQYLFYFTLGYALRRRESWLRARVLPRLTALPALLCLTAWCALFALGERYPSFLLRTAAVLAGGSFLLWLAGRERAAALLAGPGRYSLQIYLFNGFLLVPARVAACQVLKMSDPWLIVAFNEFVTFVCAYWLAKYAVSRFRAARFLTGLPG